MFKPFFKQPFETNFIKEKPELVWALALLSAFKFQLQDHAHSFSVCTAVCITFLNKQKQSLIYLCKTLIYQGLINFVSFIYAD